MNAETNSKVQARHLKRNAYLYVRQSTLRQVVENGESTRRQYDLRSRAASLGWPHERIVVIDSDLGQSGASTEREGFQKLVAEVGLGRAGIVLGLEVSRLARNSTDWHRLLEICAVTDTLILDEDGIYDPAHFNDRLLLGLKGTMSEAELHVLRARLRGGLLNKARRGELRWGLPTGLVHDAAGKIMLDPDAQVQASFRLLFATFARLGAAVATVKHHRVHKLLFPRREQCGPHAGELKWEPLGLSRVLGILKNPTYAGAYVFGRTRHRKQPDGSTRTQPLPREEWIACLRDAHQGYISWEEHERIQKQLRDTARAYGQDRRHGPPREGPALLQGLLLCGRCGRRMTVRYHQRRGTLMPEYLCGRGVKYAEATCQIVPGAELDAAIGRLLVETMTPVALELTLAVRGEIQARLNEVDRLREQQVRRAQYEADLARRRFMQVDPENRLVAESLEAEWNEKLRALADARETFEQQRAADRSTLDATQQARILALATDFPALWNDAATPQRERKRMAALLLEDITITRGEQLFARVRLRGGATTTLTLPRPLTMQEQRATPPDTLAQIDALLAEHTIGETAALLNARGLKTGAGESFTSRSIKWVCHSARLLTLEQRLRRAGMLTPSELGRKLGVTPRTVRHWRSKNLLRGRVCNDLGAWVFDPIDTPPHRARPA